MRTVQQSDSDHFGKGSAATPKASDETAYLLSSKANAKRLLKSIATLRTGTTSPGKPITLTETPIL
ncbi:hypothetical protein [Pseudomonas sp. Root329]|uniref:hypothetical protein n=1 Tax=Pseudomonas sp. Root329 TaxID=1736515 RepID=UPI0012E39F2A|nr:hypothetical protein [Pseudomonas sp. Root329]